MSKEIVPLDELQEMTCCSFNRWLLLFRRRGNYKLWLSTLLSDERNDIIKILEHPIRHSVSYFIIIVLLIPSKTFGLSCVFLVGDVLENNVGPLDCQQLQVFDFHIVLIQAKMFSLPWIHLRNVVALSSAETLIISIPNCCSSSSQHGLIMFLPQGPIRPWKHWWIFMSSAKYRPIILGKRREMVKVLMQTILQE